MKVQRRSIYPLVLAATAACASAACSHDADPGNSTSTGPAEAAPPLTAGSGEAYAAWASRWWASAAAPIQSAAPPCDGNGCAVESASTPAVQDPLRLARFWAFDHFFLNGDHGVKTRERLSNTLLAKAQPDECFTSVGGPITKPPCSGDSQPKVNDAYVWGLTKESSSLWFGTVANTHCLVESGYLGVATPQLNDYWVCEFEASQSGTGDFRAPNLFRYDLATSSLENQNPTPGSPADLLRRSTIGLRSAGNLNGVVFLAGPSSRGGINMFAFDADTHALLGVRNLPEYNDIRSWVSVGGALYTGVGITDVPTPTSPAGRVLRWVGKKSTNPSELFAFENVGDLDASAANLAVHEGRIFVSTWPSALSITGGGAEQRYSGLWRSPRLHHDGLEPNDAGAWKKLWDIRDYEPDPIAAATTGGGALASFEGRLYWGTMHVPGLATAVALNLADRGQLDLDANGNGTIDAEELLNTALGTHRAITIFAGEDLGEYDHHRGDRHRGDRNCGDDDKKPDIRILYGEKYLPTYSPTAHAYTIAYDRAHRNRMPYYQPRWGSSGLGNFFNAYTWSMKVFDDLYVGTFDWSQLARVGIQSLVSGSMAEGGVLSTGALGTLTAVQEQRAHWGEHGLLDLLNIAIPKEGADLFRFRGADRRAEAQSLTGVGNFTNYGVRNMVTDKDHLYVGTANPMNLHPLGGWELRELQR